MKNNLVCLLCVITIFFSCSPSYKASQTPDDVYYSPAKKIEAQDRYQTYNDRQDTYVSADDDDYYLRMKARNYTRWSGLDDYSYWYDSRYFYNNWYSPYTSYMSLSLGYGLGWGGYGYYPYYGYSSWYNPWNSWYSPYYTVVYYKNPDVYYKPLRNNANFSGYKNRNYNTYNMPLQNGNRNRSYNNSNINTNRRSNDTYNSNQYNNTNRNNNNSTPTRTFNNSSSGSSMSSGGGARTSGGGSRTRP